MDKAEKLNMIGCDEKSVACRFCRNAEKEHIGRCYCAVYPDGVYKPKDVY